MGASGLFSPSSLTLKEKPRCFFFARRTGLYEKNEAFLARPARDLFSTHLGVAIFVLRNHSHFGYSSGTANQFEEDIRKARNSFEVIRERWLPISCAHCSQLEPRMVLTSSSLDDSWVQEEKRGSRLVVIQALGNSQP